MTNGFSVGYLGMQDRDPKWIIFSCWDQPDFPVQVVKVGDLANTETWLEYEWELGKEYSFCVKAAPGADSQTVYSGYFMHPQHGWTLIATFNTKHLIEGQCLKGLGSFIEDWLSDENNGGIVRESYLGPALVHYSTAQVWRSCNGCRGASADTRQPAGYLNRMVQCDGSLVIQIRSGGLDDCDATLYRGPLKAHVVASPSFTLVGGGPLAGVYCAGGRLINEELYYHGLSTGTFIACGSAEWHACSYASLGEVLDRQIIVGSIAHSTNGTVPVTSTTWDEYQVLPLELP
mmetsp:Transcript_70296/g.228524  ORF Transcript_70296/g.228524 Transcript_70296/m.228524 type:complete len:289 (-) Transcript_70296:30-896(-)